MFLFSNDQVHHETMPIYFLPPVTPFYIVKLLVFLISAQNIEAILVASTHDLCFEQKYERYHRVFFYLKIFSFWR